MNLAQVMAPQIPLLRRFARALTGSQTSGDRYVASLLEVLIADPSSFEQSNSPRVEPYRLLCKLWDSLPVNLEPEQPDEAWEAAANRRMSFVAPAARKAFLLASVEGFDLDEVSTILGIPEDDARALLDQAAKEIAEQVQTRVLIIEDEPLIALDIETLVKDLGHDVVGIARTHKEALVLAQAERAGLVLADVHLADGSSGIDAVADILGEYEVPVIFITAFPERLLTGERPEPAFLITKPFLPEMVKGVISQALFFGGRT